MYVAAGAALAGGAAGLNLGQLGAIQGGWRDVALAGLTLAALGKSAQLPFSFWLSHAMAGPSPVSALLHSATMVAAGGYLLLRIEPGIAATGWLGPVVAWVGALTALLLGAVAVAQRDLKQLLAASTCSQIGFIVLAAGVGGTAGGAAQFVAHAAVKSLLFLVAGAWLSQLGTKDLLQLRGAARGHPVVGISFTVGALALGGLPPLSIWVAKDQVLSSVLPSSGLLFLVALAAAAMSAAYAAKALAVVWARPQLPDPLAVARSARLPLSELLPLPPRAGAAAVLGILALPPVSAAWQSVLGLGAARVPQPWELVVSAALAVAVIVITAWLQNRRLARSNALVAAPRWFGDWLDLEAAARVFVVRPITNLSELSARFDDRVIAGAVSALAAGTLRLSRATDARLETALAGSVDAVARATRRLATRAVRPQTGFVYQYYAQAIVAMVVLAAVFVFVR
jgi:NADH-quinone oxidoreductase subunit L